jgi:hypothetical protein
MSAEKISVRSAECVVQVFTDTNASGRARHTLCDECQIKILQTLRHIPAARFSTEPPNQGDIPAPRLFESVSKDKSLTDVITMYDWLAYLN